MVHRKKILVASLFAAASFLTGQSTSRAVIYAEVGDAGQTLAAAPNAGPATGFSGRIGAAQDADLYVFTIANAGTYRFSDVGTTVDTTVAGTLDTAIFLFSSTGAALFTNDDATGVSLESSFTATLTAGTYYFGISLSGNEPVNSANQLLFAGYPGGDTTTTRGAAAGLNPTTEANFNSLSYTADLGTYTVAITAVPEPSTWAALALGSAAAGFTILRRRSGNAL